MKIAVVTGASSGIGKEFCRQIDGAGYDEIWGLALEEDKLQNLKEELKTNVRYFACDLTKDESFVIYENALKESGAEVALLINCSGYGKFGRYDEIPLEQSLNMIDLNVKGYVRMTEVTIPYMNEGSKIMQVASVAAFQPVPYLNVYAATKAFVYSYSCALREELKPRKISVTTVCPYWTKTEFFNRATQTTNKVVSKYACMYDPKNVVKKALKDTAKGKLVSIYGGIAKATVKFGKILSTNQIMKFWVRQQKLNKKYK